MNKFQERRPRILEAMIESETVEQVKKTQLVSRWLGDVIEKELNWKTKRCRGVVK